MLKLINYTNRWSGIISSVEEQQAWAFHNRTITNWGFNEVIFVFFCQIFQNYIHCVMKYHRSRILHTLAKDSLYQSVHSISYVISKLVTRYPNVNEFSSILGFVHEKGEMAEPIFSYEIASKLVQIKVERLYIFSQMTEDFRFDKLYVGKHSSVVVV